MPTVTRRPCLASSSGGWLAAIFPAATAALVLLPKLALIRTTATTLWCRYGAWDVLFVLAQDALVATAIYLGLRAALSADRRAPALMAVGAAGLILAILMLDERARELWLRPSDLELIRWGLANAGELQSGLDLFFRHDTGFGMTLRRALPAALFVSLLAGAATVTLGRRRPADGTRSALQRAAGPLAGLLLFGGLAVASPRYRYRVEENILVSAAVEPLRFRRSGDRGLAAAAGRFDQHAVTLKSALAERPRTMLAEARPFRNLVLVFLETVRWDGLALDTDAPLMPNLARLGREGILARSRVSVPHSTKSEYEVLTGRRPYLDIEARESAVGDLSSIVRVIARRDRTRAVAYSSLFYGFENLGGLLAAAGIAERIHTSELLRAAGRPPVGGSSFGSLDPPLYELSAADLAAGRRPFVAVMFPAAAHYPYLYPGKTAEEGDGKTAYLKSLAEADRLLGDLVERFRASGLAEDTLFVLVGDHGESFGEHGVSAHNSSVYEVEVTTPLVFWSADGRLRHPGVLTARHLDVAPTVADLFGVTDSHMPVEGGSLLRGAGTKPAYLSTFFDNVQLGVAEGAHKYVYFPGDGRVVRYDLDGDPAERAGTVLSGIDRQGVIERLEAFHAYCRAWRPEPSPVQVAH